MEVILIMKTEVLSKKAVPVPLCTLQIPYGLAWRRGWGLCSDTQVTDCLSHDMAPATQSSDENVLNICTKGKCGQYRQETASSSSLTLTI